MGSGQKRGENRAKERRADYPECPMINKKTGMMTDEASSFLSISLRFSRVLTFYLCLRVKSDFHLFLMILFSVFYRFINLFSFTFFLAIDLSIYRTIDNTIRSLTDSHPSHFHIPSIICIFKYVYQIYIFQMVNV